MRSRNGPWALAVLALAVLALVALSPYASTTNADVGHAQEVVAAFDECTPVLPEVDRAFDTGIALLVADVANIAPQAEPAPDQVAKRPQRYMLAIASGGPRLSRPPAIVRRE